MARRRNENVNTRLGEPDATRRELMSSLGAFGAALGLAGCTSGCEHPDGAPVGATRQALTSANVIDFVADCGADPSGNNDCGPALAVAGQRLAALGADPRSAATSAVLEVPPGVYRVRTTGGL